MTGKLVFLDLGNSSRVPPLNTSLSFTLFCMVLCICFKFKKANFSFYGGHLILLLLLLMLYLIILKVVIQSNLIRSLKEGSAKGTVPLFTS